MVALESSPVWKTRTHGVETVQNLMLSHDIRLDFGILHKIRETFDLVVLKKGQDIIEYVIFQTVVDQHTWSHVT